MKTTSPLSIDTRASRRRFLAGAGAGALATAVPFVPSRPTIAAEPIELVHWSWLAASDGEVWAKMVDGFNQAHAGKGVKIRMELVPEEQYVTKVLASAAPGGLVHYGTTPFMAT